MRTSYDMVTSAECIIAYIADIYQKSWNKICWSGPDSDATYHRLQQKTDGWIQIDHGKTQSQSVIHVQFTSL